MSPLPKPQPVLMHFVAEILRELPRKTVEQCLESAEFTARISDVNPIDDSYAQAVARRLAEG